MLWGIPCYNKPRYFSLAATALKRPQLPMFPHSLGASLISTNIRTVGFSPPPTTTTTTTTTHPCMQRTWWQNSGNTANGVWRFARVIKMFDFIWYHHVLQALKLHPNKYYVHKVGNLLCLIPFWIYRNLLIDLALVLGHTGSKCWFRHYIGFISAWHNSVLAKIWAAIAEKGQAPWNCVISKQYLCGRNIPLPKRNNCDCFIMWTPLCENSFQYGSVYCWFAGSEIQNILDSSFRNSFPCHCDGLDHPSPTGIS